MTSIRWLAPIGLCALRPVLYMVEYNEF